MQIEFAGKQLEQLATEESYTAGFAPAIVKSYRKVIGLVLAAVDERDLRAYKALRLEKLQGRRAHQHSMRLNKQYRLIIEIKAADPKNVVVVVDIEDYH